MIYRFPYALPRHAFSHRDAARAGDVWRAFQDIAVGAASRAGWPPGRFRDTGTAFVVRAMTVVHHRETSFGEPLDGASWVRSFRRDTLCTREVRLGGASGDPVASGTQEWVHVDGQGKPARAPREMAERFILHDEGGVALPDVRRDGDVPPAFRFSFEPWYVAMDPLNHVNHPAYVDFCDEAIARVVARAGIDPADVVSVAEKVTYYAPVTAREAVTVSTSLVGRTAEGEAVLEPVIDAAGREACARAVTVRRLAGAAAPALADRIAALTGEVPPT